jgi:hypothetical protein
MTRRAHFLSLTSALLLLAVASISTVRAQCFKCERQVSGLYECIPNYSGFGWSSCIVLNAAEGCVVNGNCSETRPLSAALVTPDGSLAMAPDRATVMWTEGGPLTAQGAEAAGSFAAVPPSDHARVVRTCRGEVVAREYTSRQGHQIRDRTRRMTL